MKSLIYLGIFVGGAIGSYIPVLFGQDVFSAAGILAGAVGSFLGLWVGYKIGNSI